MSEPYGPDSNQAHPMTDAERRREVVQMGEAAQPRAAHPRFALVVLFVMAAFALIGIATVFGWLGWG